jgi:hypothetical protein
VANPSPGTNTCFSHFSPDKGCWIMPVWMEILLNVIGYGGFIAIAMLHKSRRESPKRDLPGKTPVN